MYRGEQVGVVIPAHNEAAHVGDVVRNLPAIVDRAYVVDDASTDGTWAAVTEAVEAVTTPAGVREATVDGGRAADGGLLEVLPTASRVVAVRHPDNRGRGAAVATGYRLALSDGMDVIAVMDGDGQMDPDRLERVVGPVAASEADYAKGNRLARPAYWRGMGRVRLLGNVLLTGLTRVSSGYWRLSDPQNGYTAISRSALLALPLDELFTDYGFLNDVLVELNLAGARVADVGLPAVYGDEESGISLPRFVPNVSLLLAANFLRRIYATGADRGDRRIPAAYAIAALGWVLVAVLAGVGLVTPAPAVPSAPAVPLAAAGSAVATAGAVAVDRRLNAPLVLKLDGVETDGEEPP